MPAPDAGTTINGRSGSASFKINAVEWGCSLSEFTIGSTVEQLTSMTFCTETGPTFEPGYEVLDFTLAGLLRKGVAASGPWIPAPQKVPIIAQYDAVGTNICSISFTGNFSRATASRPAGRNSVVTGAGISSGAFTVAWNISVP